MASSYQNLGEEQMVVGFGLSASNLRLAFQFIYDDL